MIFSVTIHGAPRTKKNHGRIVRTGNRPRLLPSAPFEAWQDAAVPQLRAALAQARQAVITAPVEVSAIFYRDALRGDLVGYMQALADVLQKAGVLKDDVQIVSWDGTRMRKDTDRPRVEVLICEMTKNL